jgi:uncharacterized protein
LTDAPASFRANWRAKAWGVFVIAPALVLLAFLGARILQHLWSRLVGPGETPQAAGLHGVSDVTITTPDGQRLDAWWSPPPSPGGGVVLFLHGTPGSVGNTAARLGSLQHRGLGAMAVDYRGYGRSTGSPSEHGLRIDVRAAFDYLRRAAPGSKIAVFGESLGTYPAVTLACDRPVAGVLLNAPFASLRSLWALRGNPPVDNWMTARPFDSAALIGHIRAPLMILEGSADTTVPLPEALYLFAVAHEPKTMIIVPGAGHGAAYQGATETEALAALARWTGRPDAER